MSDRQPRTEAGRAMLRDPMYRFAIGHILAIEDAARQPAPSERRFEPLELRGGDERLEGYWEKAYWEIVPRLAAALARHPAPSEGLPRSIQEAGGEGYSPAMEPLDEDAILAACREAVMDSAQVLIIAFRRYCVARWGVAPSEDDFRRMLANAEEPSRG